MTAFLPTSLAIELKPTNHKLRRQLSSSSNPVARSDGVLEYCAKSELHPPSGLGMLEGRCIPRCNPLADLYCLGPQQVYVLTEITIGDLPRSSATSAQFNAGPPRDRSTPLG